MDSAQFAVAFAQIVEPVLTAHGFSPIAAPRGWITPEKLFECNNRWFASSWDYRDLYLDAHLGRLFTFRDVLPRVIVLGPLRFSVTCANRPPGFIEGQLREIAERLPTVLATFEETLPSAMREARTAPIGADETTKRYVAEFASHLGDELTLADWRHLTAR